MASVTVEVPDDVLLRLKHGGSEPGHTLRRAAALFQHHLAICESLKGREMGVHHWGIRG
jgi:hypothetical protein